MTTEANGKQMEEKIKEAESDGKTYSLDECTQILTKKASKQKSQEDMMIAVDKLSCPSSNPFWLRISIIYIYIYI